MFGDTGCQYVSDDELGLAGMHLTDCSRGIVPEKLKDTRRVEMTEISI